MIDNKTIHQVKRQRKRLSKGQIAVLEELRDLLRRGPASGLTPQQRLWIDTWPLPLVEALIHEHSKDED
jgi:hypothetical protein